MLDELIPGEIKRLRTALDEKEQEIDFHKDAYNSLSRRFKEARKIVRDLIELSECERTSPVDTNRGRFYKHPSSCKRCSALKKYTEELGGEIPPDFDRLFRENFWSIVAKDEI